MAKTSEMQDEGYLLGSPPSEGDSLVDHTPENLRGSYN